MSDFSDVGVLKDYKYSIDPVSEEQMDKAVEKSIQMSTSWGVQMQEKASALLNNMAKRVARNVNPDAEYTPEQLQLLIRKEFSARDLYNFFVNNTLNLVSQLPAGSVVQVNQKLKGVTDQMKWLYKFFDQNFDQAVRTSIRISLTVLNGLQKIGEVGMRGTIAVWKVVEMITIFMVNYVWAIIVEIIEYIIFIVIHIFVNAVKAVALICDRNKKRNIRSLQFCSFGLKMN